MKRNKWQTAIMISLTALMLVGCRTTPTTKEADSNTTTSQKVNKEPYSEQQFLMGTYVRVKIFDEGKKEVLDDAFARVKELADKTTVNEPDADKSEVAEINRQAGVQPVKVSEDVFRLIEKAYQYSEEADQGFDLSIGPITQLWHIGFDDARKPSQAEIDEALALVRHEDVQLDKKNQTVYLTKPGMSLDLGSIAKGFIADEVVDVLKEHGVTTAIVDLGGNVVVVGTSPKKEGQPWTVGIQDPNQSRNKVVGTVPAQDQSLVTSGIYERVLEVDGKTYHHLFDPTTGYPFENHIAGVTIISKKSVDGDGLSTAIFSMGLEEGMDYIESMKDVEALFITTDDEIYMSSGLKDTFKLNEESGYTVKKLANQ